MTIENDGGILAVAWNFLLTIGLMIMGYVVKKRDDAIDQNTKDLTTLELKAAETYATKVTMMELFRETTRTNEEAIKRVEKSQDITNLALAKQGEKIDKVVDSIGGMRTAIMAELVKKT